MMQIAKQAGTSLIEVLVTVIVVSVGLLGLASLQANSLRFNHEGYLRSIAITQAEAMADRIRSNPAGQEAGTYDNVNGVIGSDPGCTSACTPALMGQQHIYDWLTETAAVLPAGTGTVVNNGGIYTVTIHYDARRTGATGLDCSGDANTDLTCVRFSVRL